MGKEQAHNLLKPNGIYIYIYLFNKYTY